jgi:hypothetical protein
MSFGLSSAAYVSPKAGAGPPPIHYIYPGEEVLPWVERG